MNFEGTIDKGAFAEKAESTSSHLELKVIVPISEGLDVNLLIRRFFKKPVMFKLTEIQRSMELGEEKEESDKKEEQKQEKKPGKDEESSAEKKQEVSSG